MKLQTQHNENVKQIVEKQAAKQVNENNAARKAGTEENSTMKAIPTIQDNKSIIPSKQVQPANNRPYRRSKIRFKQQRHPQVVLHPYIETTS